MPVPVSYRPTSKEQTDVSEQLRLLLSRWVRTTREQANTPSSAHAETLRILLDGGPASITTLAQRRSVKHQSMRLIIQELAMGKTVQKVTDPADKRRQIISITRKGRAFVKREQDRRTQWIAHILQDCSAQEMDRVVAALTTLEQLLDRASTSLAANSA